MKVNTLTKKAYKIASEIYFNDNKLKEIAFLHNTEWFCIAKGNKETFKKLTEKEVTLYDELKNIQANLFNKRMLKEITKEEYQEIKKKIHCLIDGTSSEIY